MRIQRVVRFLDGFQGKTPYQSEYPKMVHKFWGTSQYGIGWFSMVLNIGIPPNRCFPHVCAPIFGAPPKHFFLLPQESYEPFWKPSVTPYVVSFWVRQSLRHAYARRVFPYAKQIEETLTRSPYAALRKRGFRLRQTCDDKARTENVKGGF